MTIELKMLSLKQLTSQKADLVLIPVQDGKLSLSAFRTLDNAHNQALSKALASGLLGSACGDSLLLPALDAPGCMHSLLVNLGDKKSLNRKTYQKACQRLVTKLLELNVSHVINALPLVKVHGINFAWTVRDCLGELSRQHYQFTELKSDKTPRALTSVTTLFDTKAQQTALKTALKEQRAFDSGNALTRYLGDLPGNICTPTYLAEHAKKMAKQHSKLTTNVLDEAQMKKLGMGALLSVSQGSKQPAKLIVMEYQGARSKKSEPIVFVGKGITFDTGGISLKPSNAMLSMKYDMQGGATVFGLMQAIAEYNLPLNVVGVVAAAENFPAETATKPSDVVTSLSGQTIEITNTDAEGRLVLCDALTYVKKFNPAEVIDIATLTGAVITALGHSYTGVWGRDNKQIAELLKAGERASDEAWQLPLSDDYADMLQSDTADMINSHKQNPVAGSSVAACFLAKFTKDYRWMHCDIAGVASESGRLRATGRPLNLFFDYLLGKVSKR